MIYKNIKRITQSRTTPCFFKKSLNFFKKKTDSFQNQLIFPFESGFLYRIILVISSIELRRVNKYIRQKSWIQKLTVDLDRSNSCVKKNICKDSWNLIDQYFLPPSNTVKALEASAFSAKSLKRLQKWKVAF